jgi:hypothetical protein
MRHDNAPTGMCGRLRDPYPLSPLVRFRVYGSAAARREATPPPTRTSVNQVRQLCPEQRPIGIELRAALDDLGLEQHPALQTLREPEMGANVFSRPRTWSDPVRFFSQVRGSPLDSVRR